MNLLTKQLTIIKVTIRWHHKTRLNYQSKLTWNKIYLLIKEVKVSDLVRTQSLWVEIVLVMQLNSKTSSMIFKKTIKEKIITLMAPRFKSEVLRKLENFSRDLIMKKISKCKFLIGERRSRKKKIKKLLNLRILKV